MNHGSERWEVNSVSLSELGNSESSSIVIIFCFNKSPSAVTTIPCITSNRSCHGEIHDRVLSPNKQCKALCCEQQHDILTVSFDSHRELFLAIYWSSFPSSLNLLLPFLHSSLRCSHVLSFGFGRRSLTWLLIWDHHLVFPALYHRQALNFNPRQDYKNS